MTALMIAAIGGHVEIVIKLLEVGANPDIFNENPNNLAALMFAAENGHLEVVRFFLEVGANLDVVDGFGRSVLMLAAESGNNNMVELLLLS